MTASSRSVAFVLGGGGRMGAYEVGMLRALLDAEILPDLVVGTSIGALNGAAIAAEPTRATVDRLESAWLRLDGDPVFGGSAWEAGFALIRRRAYVHRSERLRELILRTIPARRFEELTVPFQCVAACIERATEHWFSEGSLVDAVLASAAIPGLLPPVRIGGEHFVDGGIVNSIPIERAVELGATEIYVLHVGRVERLLRPPTNLVQAAVVSFEIARRHRFEREVASLPETVVAHVLPTGEPSSERESLVQQLRYWDVAKVAERIARAHAATRAYLAAGSSRPR